MQFTAFSGTSVGRDNPPAVAKEGPGPLPQGRYYSPVMKIARYIANLAITLLLGDLLARQLAATVYAKPGTIESIRRLLMNSGVLKPDSQYDINGMLLLVILVASIAVVGVAVWLLNIGVRRYRQTRSQ
ncbi:hypothetical protein [Paraburkholderia bryophila]|uniref:Uncharacterized protein n=1 Tax=Paraburkholderia bryophila TaxID=420952 RepID=A0A329D5D5_9BURK|nr:hypothetical protein [Paraburkholderia bryophila]RAS37805.1 hypothetical protein BX591_10286 [Paraburkholderia bryophila]